MFQQLIFPNKTAGGSGSPLGSPTASGESCLIYKEGGSETGPVVFNSFPDLYSQLVALRSAASGGGCFRVRIDASLVAGVSVVPAGAYDLTGVILDGGGGSRLDFADGCSVTNMFVFENLLDVRNQNTSFPLVVVPNIATGVVILCRNNSGIETINGGTQPFYDVATNSTGFVFLQLLEGSRVAANGNGVVFGGVNTGEGFQSGSFLLAQIYDSNPIQPPLGGSHRPNAIKGAAGSAMLIQIENTKAVGITAGVPGTVFPSWLGSILTPQITEPSFLVSNPFQSAASTIAVTAVLGDHVRLDATAGPISQALPTISGADFAYGFPGGLLAVSDSGSGSAVTLTAGAGDTIGGNASLPLSAGGSALLISDGLSDWAIVSVYNPVIELFLSAPGFNNTGEHVGNNIGSTGQDNIEFFVPADFMSLVSIDILVIPVNTIAAADVDLVSNYAAVGEAYATHSEANASITFALKAGEITAMDVSSVFTALSALDICGLLLDNNGVTGGYLMLGIRLRYRRE